METGPNEQQMEQLISLAEDLKLAGNRVLKLGENVEAEKLYTKAIEALAPTKSSALKLLSQLYSNRAAVRLLKNSDAEAIDDCRKSIEADGGNLKAYWRAAKGSLNLELYEQAHNFAKNGLSVDPNHRDLQTVGAAAASKLEKYQERRQNESRGFTQEEAVNAQNVSKQLNEQMYLIKQKVRSLELDLARNERTIEMLNSMPSATPCFKGLGRGFVKGEKNLLVTELEVRNNQIRTADLPEANSTGSLIEKRLANAEHELTEIIQSFKNK